MTVKEFEVALELTPEQDAKLQYVCVGRMDWMLQHGEVHVLGPGDEGAIGPKRYYGAGWQNDEDGTPLAVRLSADKPEMDGPHEKHCDDARCFYVPLEILLKIFDPITEGTKFAVTAILDMAIGYLSQDGGSPYFDITHKNVVLYDTLDDALKALEKENGDGLYAVYDEAEFRARPDTW